jgi:hypothetical protein
MAEQHGYPSGILGGIKQGWNTRKVIKSLTPDEKNTLGSFLRDKEYVQQLVTYHNSGVYSPKRYQAQRAMVKHIKDRVDDKELIKKVFRITADRNFDAIRTRLATRALVPQDALGTTPPLDVTPHAKASNEKEAKREKAKSELKTWLRTAKMVNPNTKRKILVRSGLQAAADSDVYAAALSAYNSQRKSMGMRSSAAKKNLPEPEVTGTASAAADRLKKMTSKNKKRKPYSYYSEPSSPSPSFRPSYSPSYSPSTPSFRFGGGGGFSGGGSAGSF